MGPGCFFTTGDGIMDKRYSNRARQPKQTYSFKKKNRMNKTMVNALNKSGRVHKTDYIINGSNPPKRSGSGKVKKRNFTNNMINNSLGTDNRLKVYNSSLAPVMTMTTYYKKKLK
jgi:hypothetical protein